LKDVVGVEALLLTHKSLKKNQDNIMETLGRLQERLDSIISNRDPDREGEELTSLKKCLEVCNKVSNLLSNQELNIGGDVPTEAAIK
jgi:DNA topoisomerase IA